MQPEHLTDLIEKVTSPSDGLAANPRVSEVVGRIVKDLFHTIEDLDVTPEEFWSAMDYLRDVGTNNEFGLLAPGLGFEHLLDLRMDEAEHAAGLDGATPRTIEGPLFVPGAPKSKGDARLDDGSDEGDVVFMSGRILSTDGTPIDGAVVDVWHANTRGLYSIFDSDQTPYNLRRKIETGSDGRYAFRSILPSGYACPPNGPTQQLLDQLGRHGNRPAHIHIMVEAPDHRTLTTQINLDGDEYLNDDFAFATREELVAVTVLHDDPADIEARGLTAPFYTIDFDFNLNTSSEAVDFDRVDRARVEAQMVAVV
ncbi:catechol 1,2-dioxygenase [uncultured Tateyamaria sp.]|uniref:catechol 1,2-dioxygenase n=1 Tax=uncultured Tateyamaria sp. TaxID=455651 RepID=UPI00262EFF2D|nr:catechol 1,2-dioxygenase [uncultured Tateyamaria sp.]